MWFVLYVTLFSVNPGDTPVMLKPQFFTTAQQCKDAGNDTAQAITAAKLESVAAVDLSCRMLSNPTTEKSQ